MGARVSHSGPAVKICKLEGLLAYYVCIVCMTG